MKMNTIGHLVNSNPNLSADLSVVALAKTETLAKADPTCENWLVLYWLLYRLSGKLLLGLKGSKRIAWMAVLVGIDEAGFGPLLGPLVVSSTAYSLARHSPDTDLWRLLNKSVAGTRKRLAGRLFIADSKKAYSRSIGIKHLQRTVLACLKSLGHEPATLHQLLSCLCPDCLPRLSNYPWYSQTETYPLNVDRADIAIASTVFEDDMTSNNIKLLHLKSCCLDVAYYNKMVRSVRNKASVLFTATSVLIKHAFENFAAGELQIIVDRQGGRVHYRKILQRMFDDMHLTILAQSPACSSYELRTGSRKMRLHFVVGADSRFLPTSLASMASKYIRELLVDNINRYFAAHCASLKPTAGYWKDGLRFVSDIKKNLPHLQYNADLLIRSK
jgi:ribonuclease HII